MTYFADPVDELEYVQAIESGDLERAAEVEAIANEWGPGDPDEVEEIINRLAEAQQTDNRFRAAIIEDTERRAAIWADPDQLGVAHLDYNTALDRELGISSPDMEDDMTIYNPHEQIGSPQGGPPMTGYMPPYQAPPAPGPGDDVSLWDKVRTWFNPPGTEGYSWKPGDPLATGNFPTSAIGSELWKLAGPALLAGAGLLASRVKFPWQTPEGEGFIAPWTNQQVLPGGLTGRQAVVDAAGYGAAPAGLFGQAGGAAYGWTNAAKDGSTQPTAQYIRTVDGKTYVRSLKTGVIKRVRRPKVVAVHSRMRLGDVARAQRKLDTLYKQVAKRTPLKRGK